MASPQIIGYDSRSRLLIRDHAETGSVSIDIPPLGPSRFFNVKSRGGLVVFLTWCGLCAFLPLGAAALIARVNPEMRTMLLIAPVPLAFLLLILALVYAVIAKTHTYLRASPTELMNTTRGPGDDLNLRIPRASIESIAVQRPRSDMSLFLVIRYAGADPLNLLQQYPQEDLNRIHDLLRRTLQLP